MKLIYKHDNVAVLHSAKNVLALNDIESFVKDEQSGPTGARFGASNVFMELWLKDDEDFERAASIIEHEIENPEIKKSWICAACREENEGSFELCWNCRTDKGAVDN